MNITINKTENHAIVKAEGRLDTIHADNFEKQMLEVFEGTKGEIILDCSGLEYISSTGLRVFLIVQKKMGTAARKFKICNLQPIIKEIFEVSGFNMVFSIFPDLKSALAS